MRKDIGITMNKILRLFSAITLLFFIAQTVYSQPYDGKKARWELLQKNWLAVEDVYYDFRRFRKDNLVGADQYYVWFLSVYDRRRGIEHFNGDFEVVYVDDVNAHQSVVQLEIIECENKRHGSAMTEYYYDAFPNGQYLISENHENILTLPIIDNDPYDRFCKRVQQ